MRTWRSLVWVFVLAAPVAFAADHAHSRGGGGGSGGGGGTSAAPSSNGGGSSSGSGGSQGSGSTANPGTAHSPSGAEARQPRPGQHHSDGHSHNGHHGGGVYWGGYYYPYYPYYPGFYPYTDLYYPYPYNYSYHHYDDSPAVRVQVNPDKAHVYVDGYYAGIVDDFDGLFQRLYVAPGRHEIKLKLEGYRTHSFLIYAMADHTVKLHFDMAKGEGTDAPEDMTAGIEGEPYRPYDDGGNPERDIPAEGGHERRPAPESGTLDLDLHPRDASVYIDGDLYRQAAHDDVRLAAGPHHLEVVRPGYRTVEKDFEIRPGKTTELDVSLEQTARN